MGVGRRKMMGEEKRQKRRGKEKKPSLHRLQMSAQQLLITTTPATPMPPIQLSTLQTNTENISKNISCGSLLSLYHQLNSFSFIGWIELAPPVGLGEGEGEGGDGAGVGQTPLINVYKR